MSAQRLTLTAPLAGWSTPLAEVPDEVFAQCLLGDGVAIDPTADTLFAPCDAEVIVIAAAHHALTLRTEGGCEILLHVGLDTVALKGTGFELLARLNTRVHAGEPLLRFNLDFLAQQARSLLTPVVIGLDSGFRITRRALGSALRAGDFLMELEARGVQDSAAATLASADEQVARISVGLAHGLHARPAALLAGALRNLDAHVRLAAHGREANARSTVALMGLGVARGEELEARVSGPDAAAALAAVRSALTRAEAGPAAAVPRARATPQAQRADLPAGALGGVIASRGFAVGPVVQLQRAAGAGAGARRRGCSGVGGAGARTVERARAARARASAGAAPWGCGARDCPGAPGAAG